MPRIVGEQRAINLQALGLGRNLSNAFRLVDEASLILRQAEQEVRESEIGIGDETLPTG